MNKFELKTRLKKAYPDLKNHLRIEEIMASTEFINTDVQTLIDRSVASVKDLFTVRTIDVYAEKLETFTQDFLDRLDKLGVHWLISHQPTGLNFYSDEMNYVFSEPFAVQSGWASYYSKLLRIKGKDKTFIINSITEVECAHSEVESAYIIRGKLVRKSILAELLQE